MRRLALLLCCILFLCLPVPAAEENGSAGVITSYEMTAVVGSQAAAQVSAVVNLHLNESTAELVVPLGKNASNCVINGVRVSVRKVNGVPSVVLRNEAGFLGDLQINMTYQLGKCVSNLGVLELPVLASSYAYPIENLSFHVTLPGEFGPGPTFQSGYLGEDADNYLDVQVDGPVIHGKLLEPMRDHDSLTLFLETPETMFARQAEGGTLLGRCQTAVAVFGALMALYWFLTLRWKPVWPGFQYSAPLGETAGESWSLLTGGNLSFSLMVVSWAQMGYLTIVKDRDVTLHRRMDMGNERSELEIRAFRRLFRRNRPVSATGGEFQRLRREMDSRPVRAHGMWDPNSGSPVILRGLGALACLCASVALGDCALPVMQARFLPLILFGLLGLWAGWTVQSGVHGIWGRDRGPVIRGAAAGLLLLILGIAAAQPVLALLCLGLEILAGLATAFGGRRTEDGRRLVQGELGLRRFLRREYKERHQSAQHQNPSYYYDLAPYALALGVDGAFARRFEKMELPPCAYLRCRVPGGRAVDFQKILRETVDLMDGRPTGLERSFLGRMLLAATAARRRPARRTPARGRR